MEDAGDCLRVLEKLADVFSEKSSLKNCGEAERSQKTVEGKNILEIFLKKLHSGLQMDDLQTFK